MTVKHSWLVSAKFLALSLVLLGVIYPLVVFVAGRVLFPFRADGSVIREGNKILGSDLIAQDFSLPEYFQPRPSACGFNPMSSGGSNLAPTSAKLVETYRERVRMLKLANAAAEGRLPLELIAASASGLDPDISLGAALWQLPRVARARSLPRARIEELVRAKARPPLFGFVGEWRVNVFELNRRLDQLPPLEKAQKNE